MVAYLKKKNWQTVIWHETLQLRPAYLFLKHTNEKKNVSTLTDNVSNISDRLL